jgi:DNA-binding transcriptional LysR family regulator
LRHLRYFVAIAQEASFTSAARRVHVTQQALSAQIRQLEDVVGVRLFDRNSEGVSLTPAGEVFFESATATLATLDHGIAAARNSANRVRGQLSVGLHVAAGSDTPTALLANFHQAYPDIEVKVKTYDLRSPASGLLDGSSDVAFVRPPVDAPGLRLETVAEEPSVFVLQAGHPLARRPAPSLADVAGLPWVAAEPSIDGCRPTSWRDAWLFDPRPGGDQLVVGATASTIDECREHVVAGRGITVVPACAETHYARPGLAFVPAEGLPPAATAVAWRADDTRTEVERFVVLVTGTATSRPSQEPGSTMPGPHAP